MQLHGQQLPGQQQHGCSMKQVCAFQANNNRKIQLMLACAKHGCSHEPGASRSSRRHDHSSNDSSIDSRDRSSLKPKPEAYQKLPPSFWDERRVLYNRMRHERDRTNRRKRLQALRAAEESVLSQLPPEARATYEAEQTSLRIAAAQQQKAQLSHALQHGLRVIIDCSYILPAQRHTHQRPTRKQQQQQWQQQEQQLEQQQDTCSLVCKASGLLTEPDHFQQAVADVLPDLPAGQSTSAGSSSSNNKSSNNNNNSSILAELDQAQQPAPNAYAGSNQHGDGAARRHKVQHQRANTSHEVRSLAKQIELSVAVNKRSAHPVALTATSFTGDLEIFANHMGATSWPLNKHAESLLELLAPEQLVILSPDAEDPLLALDPCKAYVIGGIVDRSVRKGMTRSLAAQHGIQAVRLPIKEHAARLGLAYSGASTRPALSVTDVVVALLEYQRTQDWVTALTAAMPARRRRQQPAAASASG